LICKTGSDIIDYSEVICDDFVVVARQVRELVEQSHLSKDYGGKAKSLVDS
jgi:hypothetical protein